MSSALHAFIRELEQDACWLEPNRLRERGEVLDRLETYLGCGLPQDADASMTEAGLQQRMVALRDAFEAADHRLYQSIRHDIQQGGGARTLLAWVTGLGSDNVVEPRASGDSYDYLDVLIAGVLQIDEPDAQIAELADEMVFYQPTPARHIFDMIRRSALDKHDVLVDLGAGLGHVPLLAAICTGARCIGVEWELAYVDCARRCAQALHLTQVTFIRQDARAADLSTGTVFYLYTPFTGTILREVLDALRGEAAKREIRICTLGPCTSIVALEPWLEAVGAQEINQPTLFRSIEACAEILP
ncbi:class I SAM-dependent methyltransferase [Dyella silvatica]|uniref:class I SAM-dependent methyltransferase n=1 Tax=Dyella silvatica TaxID=2992128 RepID=UPI002252BD76|nr:class I SAM-dependent methyltransferase [Dyella silvatica]